MQLAWREEGTPPATFSTNRALLQQPGMSIREQVFEYLRDHPAFVQEIDTYMEGGMRLVEEGVIPDGPDRAGTVAKYISQWEDIEEGAETPDDPDWSDSEPEDDAPDWAERLFEAGHVSHLADKEGIDNPDSSDIALIDWEEEQYYFQLNKYPNTSLSFPEVEELVRAYVYEGSGMTRSSVVRYAARPDFRETVGEEHVDNASNLQKGQLKRIYWALNVDKESLPFAPHEYDDESKSVNDLVQDWRGQQEAAVEHKYRQTEADDWKRRYRKEVKERIRQESVAENIEEHLAKNPPSVHVESEATLHPQSGKAHPCHYAIALGDWHLGQVVRLKQNQYDKDVAQERLDLLAERLLQFFQRNRRPFSKLYFVLLGDMLDGANGNMRAGQQAEQDLYYEEQTRVAAECITELIGRVAATIEQVPIQVEMIPGNHGRGTQDRNDDPKRIVELSMYQTADALLGQLDTSDRISTHIESDVVGEFSSFATQILYTHGERIPDMEDTITALQDKSKKHHLLLQGHYHHRQQQELEHLDGLGIQSGSLIGDTSHGRHQLGTGARASQRLIEIDERGPRTPGTFLLDDV